LNGKRSITAETALRLGRYFGNAPQFWINLQARYDLAVAMRDVGRVVEREVQTAA
jgi:addiction module HigA family antidote